MTTYELPPEPPNGTRLADKRGTVWTREDFFWTCVHSASPWGELVTHYAPLTEAPALPTKPGTIIRATGADTGEPFKDEVLLRDYDGYWQGVTATLSPIYHPGDRIDSFTILDTYDPAAQVVVPRKEYEALRKVVTTDSDCGGIGIATSAQAARELVCAAEEAER